MGKQLSRALEMRRSVSGMHFQNVRLARRVERAGLTTGGSFDDTMTDLRLEPIIYAPSVLAFVPLFSLVLWILALCSDIRFSYPPHFSFWALQHSISLTPSSPLSKPVHISHLSPAIPLS